ncbi:MAG: hypothetical protein V4580_11890 [Bacteroidota bacterium]
MIFFKLKALEKKLIEGNVSDKHAFNYFLILSLISSLSIYLLNEDAPNSQVLFFNILFTLALTYVGLTQCFKVNATGDHKEFYKRLFSLSFVILVRIFCWCLLLLIPYWLILIRLGLELGTKGSLFIEIADFIFDKILQILFYILLYKSLKKISTHHTVNG